MITKLKWALLLFGLLVFGLLVYQTGPLTIAREIREMGFMILLVFVPYALVYICDTFAWRWTLGDHKKRISIPPLFLIRTAGEAVNAVTPSAYLGGEPVKAYLLKKFDIPLVDGLASVVTAKTTMTIAQIGFILLGLGFAWLKIPQGHGVFPALVTAFLLAVGGVSLFLLLQRRGLFSSVLALLRALRIPLGFLKKKEERLASLDILIREFYTKDVRGFFLSLAWFFSGWMAAALESFLILYLLGIPVDLMTAISLEAIAILIKGVGFFIPGSLGAQEGGNLLVFIAFGWTVVAGMTYSIVRRIRELIWIAIGLAVLARQDVRGGFFRPAG